MTVDPIARALADARRFLRKLDDYPGPAPADLEAAYAVQDAVSRALGWRVAGWKLGCTSSIARRALGAAEPFFGPVFAERLYRSGEQVPTGARAMRVVEPEVAVTLGRDLPARAAPYALEEVQAAIASVHPALEIVDRRAPGGFEGGLLWHIADGAVDDALVLGQAHPPLSAEAYAELVVLARIDGRLVSSGIGRYALGGAHLALLWLANALSRRGRSLAAGEVVTTGLATALFAAEPGDTVEAEFAQIGSVAARL